MMTLPRNSSKHQRPFSSRADQTEAPTSMGPMERRRFFSWTSVVDDERPSMETVRRTPSTSASPSPTLGLVLTAGGRPRPIGPPHLPRPRPDRTTCNRAAVPLRFKKKTQSDTEWRFFRGTECQPRLVSTHRSAVEQRTSFLCQRRQNFKCATCACIFFFLSFSHSQGKKKRAFT